MESIMPAKRALDALEQPPAADPVSIRRISKKVRVAIDAMVSGDCKKIVDAARQAGLSREHLSRELSKPHIVEHMRQRVMRSLSVASARAGATKVELLDSPSELVRDRASSFVLGLAGIQPAAHPSVNVNIEMRAGYVIDLSEPEDRMRDVTPMPPHE